MVKSIPKILLLTSIFVFVLVLGLSLGFSVGGLGKDASVYATSNAVLNYSNLNYPTVNVTNDEELRAALTSEGNKLVVVTSDITCETVYDSKENKYSSIDSIVIADNKILHLNGHDIYYSDSSQLRKLYDGSWGYSESNKNLIEVGEGATLTIADNEENKGVLQFDSTFATIEDTIYPPVRNVINVTTGGKVNIHGGNIIAGRGKEVYADILQTDTMVQGHRNVMAYNIGSALLINGGNAIITNGTLEGRGKGYFGKESHTCGAIEYSKGSLLIENAKVIGKGRALAIRMDTLGFSQEERDIYDIKIRNGYFESDCESRAAYPFNDPHRYDCFLRAGKPYADAFYWLKFDSDTISDPKATFALNPENTTVTHTSTNTGDKYTDSAKDVYVFTEQNKTLSNTLRKTDGLQTAETIYQHQRLDVLLDYWGDAYWKYNSSFYNTDLMKSFYGVTSDANKLKEYNARYGIEAYFQISKKVASEYQLFSAFSVVRGMNEQFPTTICLKAGDEKWDVGNDYKIECIITEKSGDRVVSNITNTLMVNVLSSSEMLEFEDIQPEEYSSNLGNRSIDTNLVLKFNATAKVELDSHLSLVKSVMVRKPSDSQYINVNYNSANGTYTIPIDEKGYYSIIEMIQLKNGSNVVAQKTREMHFMGVDVTKNATVNTNPNGKIQLANMYGKVLTKFKPGETVYVQTTPNSNSYRTKTIIVAKSKGGNVSVSNGSFTMPDDDVTVSVVFEVIHKLNYRASANAPIDQTIDVGDEGVVLKGATYQKEGYKQTGWKIGNTTYAFGDTYIADAHASAFPVFSPIQYTNVHYNINDNYYTDVINYNYSVNPYYTILSDSAFNSSWLNGQYIEYFTIEVDYESEAEGITYTKGTRFYPGQKIIPMQEGIGLYAHTRSVITINPLEIAIEGNNKLDIGTNNFGLEAPNVKFYLDVEQNNELTQIDIVAHTPKTVRVYVYADTDYRFAVAAGLSYDFPNFFEQVVENAFMKEPLIESFMVALDGSSIGLDITFYPTCGKLDSDHNWGIDPTDTPHWCVGNNNNEYTCLDCGVKKYEPVADPGNLTIPEMHRLIYVDEVDGDCSIGENSINAHYECTDCGKWFARHGLGSNYEEITIDDVIYLHSWADSYGLQTVFGQQINVHYQQCAECGAIDESTYGFHHNDEHGYGICDECGYNILCEHQWTYVEDLSTCNHKGSMTKTCEICGDVQEEIYNYTDHTLVYVEAIESTCTINGKAAYYICSHCGKKFDEDIYVHIKEIDSNGVRLENLDVKYPNSEFDHAGEYASNPAYASDYDLQQTILAYIELHEITNPATLPLDNTKHLHTEIRDAVAVTKDTDGYTGDLYCVDCDAKLEDGEVIAKHTHNYTGKNWEFDETNHWNVCDAYEGCEETINVAAHTYGEWTYVSYADSVGKKWQECSVCGHVHVEDYEAQPIVDGNDKIYKITDGLGDLAGENGKDVRYIFDLASSNDGSVTFETEKATIIFDKDAVKDIAGHDVKLKAIVSKDSLDLAGFNIPNAQMVIELSLSGVTFANGKAKVVVPVDVQIPENSEVKVFYVNGNNKEDMNATYADSKITFETTHFSKYVIAFEQPEPEIEPQPNTPEVQPSGKKPLGGGAIAGIVIACVVVLAGVGVGVFFLLKKKGIIGKK